MRTQLFRTDPVLIDGTNVVVALKDIDGAQPFSLFIENLDAPASLTTVVLFKSKNANLTFTAVTPGTGGNSIRVRFTTAADQAFSVSAAGNDITVALACGPDGVPNREQNFSRNVMDSMNASGPVSALVTASLAPGSDGSAQCDSAVAFTNLAGGAAAGDVSLVEVAISSLPPAQTPAAGWLVVVNEAPAAGGTTAYEFDPAAAVRGLRVRATKGVANGMLVAAAIVKKKSI